MTSIATVVVSVSRPVKELKGFECIHLAAGESKEVSFDVKPEMLKLYNGELQHVIEPGLLHIMVGPDSRHLESLDLTVTQ